MNALCVVALTLCVLLHTVSGAIRQDADLISATIDDVVNNQGQHDFIQNLYDTELFSDVEENGLVIAAGLSSQIENLLREKNAHLRAMRDSVLQQYLSTDNTATPTYYDADENYDGDDLFSRDLRYNNESVSFNVSTVKLPRIESEETNRLIAAGGSLDALFADQSEIDGTDVVYQFFAGRDGSLRLFPGKTWIADRFGSTDYDSRLSSWYTRATTGSKSVVIVIDGSSSMSGKLEEVKVAAKGVLRSLSATDYSLVFFANGEDLQTLDCFQVSETGYNMVRGTEENKLHWYQWIDSLTTSASSSDGFLPAFSAADIAIQDTQGQQECDPVVFFYTATAISREDMVETVEEINTVNATYFTFGYGDSNDLILESVACRTGGDHVNGDLTNIQDWSARYYEILQLGLDFDKPYWEANIGYSEQAGFGLVLSGSLVVVDRTEDNVADIIGVVGLNYLFVPIQNIFVNFKRGLSFATLLTEQGDSLLSPNDRDPRNVVVSLESPMFYDVTLIESDPDFLTDIRPAIIDDINGAVEILASRELPKGDINASGFKLETVNVVFAWQRLTGFPFTVLTSLALRDIQTRKFEASAGWPITAWLRSDLIVGTDNETLLPADFDIAYSGIYRSSLSLTTSTFKVPPRAFTDSSLFTTDDYNDPVFAARVQAYMNNLLFSDIPNNNFNVGIVRTAKDHVQITAKAQEQWKLGFFGDGTDYELPPQFNITDARLAVIAYVGLEDGSFRGYPGLFDYGGVGYDPTKRPWYETALANLGLTSLSVPYEDAFGAGKLITVSKSLTSSTVEPGKEKQFIGAVGADLLYSKTVDLLIAPIANGQCATERTAPNSTQCYLIDTSGLLIIHPDFSLENFTDITAVTESDQVFIGEYEPALAEQLVDFNFLKLQTLSRYDSGIIVSAWLTNDNVLGGQGNRVLSGEYSRGVRDGNNYCSSGSWSLIKVDNANLYLIEITNYNFVSEDNCYSFTAPPEVTIDVDVCEQARINAEDNSPYKRLLLDCPRVVFDDEIAFADDYRYTSCDFDWRELDYVSWDDSVAIAAAAVTACFMAYAILVIILMLVYRDKQIIAFSSLNFLFINMCGCMLGLIAVFVMIGEPNEGRCMSVMWLIFIAFALVYSTVFARTFRTWRTFDPKSSEIQIREGASDKDLGIIIFLFHILPIIVLAVWTGVDPLTGTIKDIHDDKAHQVVYACDSDDADIFLGILIAYCGVLLIVGAVMAFLTRNASIPLTYDEDNKAGDSFKESKYLGFVIYNIMLCIAVFVPLATTLDGDPTITFIVTAAAIWVVVAGTITLLFLPKIYYAIVLDE